jgi:hypothetical protein
VSLVIVAKFTAIHHKIPKEIATIAIAAYFYEQSK